MIYVHFRKTDTPQDVVQNNPIYETKTSRGFNPLYETKTKDPPQWIEIVTHQYDKIKQHLFVVEMLDRKGIDKNLNFHWNGCFCDIHFERVEI